MWHDAEGRSVAVEIKRRGDIDGVEQLTRYLELLHRVPAQLVEQRGRGKRRALHIEGQRAQAVGRVAQPPQLSSQIVRVQRSILRGSQRLGRVYCHRQVRAGGPDGPHRVTGRTTRGQFSTMV